MAEAKKNKGTNIGGVKAKTNKGWANLKPAKKGEVRNPKGRPQGIMDFRKRVEMSINFLAEQFVEKHNLDPKNAGKPKMKVEDVDIMGDIFAQYLNRARNGDLKATDSLFDRVYGKAKQPVELTGANGGAIEHSVEMANAEADVDQWMEGWVKVKKDGNNKSDTRTEGQDKSE